MNTHELTRASSSVGDTSSRRYFASTIVSGLNPEDRYILSVLVKRTYLIMSDGCCRIASEQLPLIREPVYSNPNANGHSLLEHDTDLFPFKQGTDIVLKGGAYAPRWQPMIDVTLAVGSYHKTIRVFGDRQCWRTRAGSIAFTPPQPFEMIPLSFAGAYGGSDAVAEQLLGNPFVALAPYLPDSLDISTATPFAYPRNPCGRGYVVTPDAEALEQTSLPNLEDPTQLLTPETLAVGTTGRWPRMPLPQCFDWYDYGWFPRVAFLGFVPEHDPLTSSVEEARRGYAPVDIMQDRPIVECFSYQVTSGACPGLTVPYLTGNEAVLLNGLHPSHDSFVFRLPCETPHVTISYRDKLHQLRAQPHTLMIEPDEDRLTLLWRLSLVVQRPYFQQEMDRFPYTVSWEGLRPA